MKKEMRVFMILILAAGALAAGKVEAMGPSIPGTPVIPMDALMYEKKNVPVPTFKMDAEFKLIFGRGWSLPALPGSQRARDRESNPFVSDGSRRLLASMVSKEGGPGTASPTPTGNMEREFRTILSGLDRGRWGLVIRPRLEVSAREFNGYAQVPNQGRIGSTEFHTEGVKGTFGISRADMGVRLGLTTRFLGLTAGFDMSNTWLRIRADFQGMGMSGQAARLSEGMDCMSFGFFAESAPIPWSPDIRFYFQISRWSVENWSGREHEFGVKVRFAGFMIFGAYRDEQYRRNVGSDESRIECHIQGIVFGIGLSL